MIEQVDALRAQGAEIASFRGVLNGTCNFVLDQIASGKLYDEALREAQQIGYAEADPSLDVDGIDAAQKLSILAHHAFDEHVDVDDIECIGISGVNETWVQEVAQSGGTVRLVAQYRRENGRVRGRVGLEALPRQDRLSNVRGGGNCLEIATSTSDTVVINGRGAGRYPTAESVVADVLSLARSIRKQKTHNVVTVRQTTEGVLA